MQKTKIICTIGPASESPKVIRELIISGMNIARLNFSHGTHEQHRELIRHIREASEELGRPIAVLQDLQGPKIRVGKIRGEGIRLEPGEEFILTNREGCQTDHCVSITYPDLPSEVEPGDHLMLADGLMELEVVKTSDTDIYNKVIIGGQLTSHKGINLPTGTIKADPITDKDRNDLAFGLENGVDYVALSFVKRERDILALKGLIQKAGKDTPVIAKIEKHEALGNIDAIIEAADGIMVARGDLGVEIPLQNVPGIQKQLIRQANAVGKPVIIATQMLRSMIDSPRPTRAEATDVANAVLDGTDAIMLSEETASGEYPVQAVRFMGEIATAAEATFPHRKYLEVMPKREISEAVAYAACILAENIDARAIVATTRSGFTAKQISRFKPRQSIIALSPEPDTVRQLSMYWGCYPSLVPERTDTDERFEEAARAALDSGMLSPGDRVVITAGHPVWEAGTTNLLWVKTL